MNKLFGKELQKWHLDTFSIFLRDVFLVWISFSVLGSLICIYRMEDKDLEITVYYWSVSFIPNFVFKMAVFQDFWLRHRAYLSLLNPNLKFHRREILMMSV